jgi:hypothetical protein
VTLEPLEQPGTNARQRVQRHQAAEAAMSIAVFHDAPGEVGADPGEPGNLGSRRTIEVDLLALLQRLAGEARAVTVLQERGGVGTEDGNGARRVAGIEQGTTDRLTDDSQTG